MIYLASPYSDADPAVRQQRYDAACAVAAAMLRAGQAAFLMELDPPYCGVIVQRCENLTGKKAERTSSFLPGSQ